MTSKNVLKILKGLSDLEELDLPLNIKISYALARDRQILMPIASTIEEK